MATTRQEPEPGGVEYYLRALYAHNSECEACCPGGGLPRENGDPELCETGRNIRFGLGAARGREAGASGAIL